MKSQIQCILHRMGVMLLAMAPAGWTAQDSKHADLFGGACQTLFDTLEATLTATFPCDALIAI